VIGSVVYINDQPVTMVGVMPEGFINVYEQNMWMPLRPVPALEGDMVGRLRDVSFGARGIARVSVTDQQGSEHRPGDRSAL
jgi:hypothetical protein